jgi:hypothetical protein
MVEGGSEGGEGREVPLLGPWLRSLETLRGN